MISPWPDYMTKEVLARRISLKLGAIDQYVSRGLLPPPHKLDEIDPILFTHGSRCSSPP